MKRIGSWLLAVVLALALTVPAGAAFSDVPEESSLAAEVQKAVDYGLMNGYNETQFGYGDPMTRAQFVAVLTRMMEWETVEPVKATFQDVPVNHRWYTVIETALAHDVVDAGESFRPGDAVTRGEMAEMLVRALGLKSSAAMAEKGISLPFEDVAERRGYIAVAYAIGMTKGTGATTFAPDANATRAQAAAMLVRIYEKLQTELDYVHSFYAISSYSQLDYAQGMNAVSAGWSRMTWNGEEALLSTTSADGNEFYVPSGYQSVTNYMKAQDIDLHLNVFMNTSAGLAEMLASENGRQQAVEQIINELTVDYKTIGYNPYAGVTVDFEGLRAAQSADFNAFLEMLAEQVHAMEKSLYVCVSPVLTTGSYYDGYDYRVIGDLADKVILMAYDYDSRDLSAFVGTEFHKTAAPAPMDQVFLSLAAITDPNTGVADLSKVVLGFSSKSTAWQIDKNGKLVSGTPVYPDTKTVYERLHQPDTVKGWSDAYQMPYIIYSTDSGEQYFLWYDTAKPRVNAAKLLGVTGVSIWRLGTVPMDSSWNWAFMLPN